MCRFKDERRCCYLIANELGSENTYTTGQVSRKLKQLGLRLPRGKKSEAGMKLQDDHDDSSADESDNETLLAFKKRLTICYNKMTLMKIELGSFERCKLTLVSCLL